MNIMKLLINKKAENNLNTDLTSSISDRVFKNLGNSAFEICSGMEELVFLKKIDLDKIQTYVDSGYIKLYAANCMPNEINYWLDKGTHYTINTVYYCSKCGKFYYTGFCLYGNPIMKEIAETDALDFGKRMEWGYLGQFFEGKSKENFYAESIKAKFQDKRGKCNEKKL